MAVVGATRALAAPASGVSKCRRCTCSAETQAAKERTAVRGIAVPIENVLPVALTADTIASRGHSTCKSGLLCDLACERDTRHVETKQQEKIPHASEASARESSEEERRV